MASRPTVATDPSGLRSFWDFIRGRKPHPRGRRPIPTTTRPAPGTELSIGAAARGSAAACAYGDRFNDAPQVGPPEITPWMRFLAGLPDSEVEILAEIVEWGWEQTVAHQIIEAFGRAGQVADRWAYGDPDAWDYVLAYATVLTGMQDVAEAIAGVDVAEQRLLSTTERWLRGSMGVIQGLTMIAGGWGMAARIGPKCFEEGTEVHTADGPRPIEDIKPGDYVWSMAEPGTAPVLRRVVRIFTSPLAPILEITIEAADGGRETMCTTATHPFWVDNERWLRAGQLCAGMQLTTLAGEAATVVSVVSTDRRVTVYNLEVEGSHTYFVAGLAVWSHNMCWNLHLGGLSVRSKHLGQHQGREFRVDTLEIYQFDRGQPRHIRGWLAQERRRVDQGRADRPRNPPGYEQAHGRTTPAREGYDYSNSRLQGKDLNWLEEKIRRLLENSSGPKQ